MKVGFSRQIFEKKPSNFMKIRPVGARVPCGRTDGQAGMTKLIDAFQNFAKAPTNKKKIVSLDTMKTCGR